VPSGHGILIPTQELQGHGPKVASGDFAAGVHDRQPLVMDVDGGSADGVPVMPPEIAPPN
jgi:hypothetical protein